ncbi:Ribosome-binding factor A [Bienertia sinuspersici]
MNNVNQPRNKLTSVGVKGKNPVATTTPTPTLVVNASATNDGKDVFAAEQQLGNDGNDWDDILAEELEYDDDEMMAYIDQLLERRRAQLASRWAETESDMKNVELVVGLRFTSRIVFKEAIVAYSIQQHKDMIYLKNDEKFISVRCANCSWELTLGPDLEDQTGWQIKSLQPIHEWCTRTFKNRLITEHWLVNEYLDKIMRNPFMKGVEIKPDMRARYDIVVGIRQCQRAKGRALNAVQSLMEQQYGKTFWKPEGEGLVLAPDIIKKGLGKKKNCKERTIPDLVRSEVPTPSQNLKEIRKDQEKIIYAGRGTPTTSTPWLEATMGRGRAKKGKGKGKGIPIGIGVIYGE